ncbi:ABC transporter substrate-binding protein [Pseudonocardia sp. H11422]|uniref:ABC transporter substrate-binding protein n=1 Tax=Pseudonocardia sp. H11422 TaxID=2835866 RepID=UPI001BDC3BD2|nr:ABC transporter substrate-binding protein [Pseudonocardia sp. H11422]
MRPLGLQQRPPSGVSRRSVLRGALAVTALPALAACGQAGPADPATTPRLTVTDLAGETLTLDGPARRVVTIPLPAASMVVAVHGGPDVLVGMNAASLTAMRSSYLGEVHPQLLALPSDVAGSDFSPSIESILRLSPDVVIQWGNRSSGIIEPLRNAGLQVAQLTYGTQEDLEGAALLYGRLLGRQDRAERMVTGMRERLRAVRTQTPDLGTARPTVLYLRTAERSLTVGGGASYNHFVIDLAGGVNPAADIPAEQAEVDLERILAWDPDIILLGTFDAATPAALYANPALDSVRAVRERRVYKIPVGGYRWDPPSQESPLMWRWLAGLVHGTGAPGLRAEVAAEYEFLYGRAPTDAQLDTILQARLNAGSAGYATFGR